jgi:hypothetical protein
VTRLIFRLCNAAVAYAVYILARDGFVWAALAVAIWVILDESDRHYLSRSPREDRNQ